MCVDVNAESIPGSYSAVGTSMELYFISLKFIVMALSILPMQQATSSPVSCAPNDYVVTSHFRVAIE